MKQIIPKLKSGFNRRRKAITEKWGHFFDSFYLREQMAIVFIFILLLVPFICLLYRGYIFATYEIPIEGGSYTEGAVGQPNNLNPIYSASSVVDRSISNLIFSGLTKLDHNGEVLPDLAESWEISEDKKTYTFKLRGDVKWHDGQDLLSGDVYYTYSVLSDPDYLGPAKNQWKDITIEISDEFTVVFTLPKEDRDFLKKTTIGVIPQHNYSRLAVSDLPYAEENLRPIGSGPFRFKEMITANDDRITSLVLEKNEEYYSQKPYLESIIIRFYENGNEILAAMEKKEINGTCDITPYTFEELEKIERIRLYSWNQPSYKAVFFNTKRNDLFSSERVRAALSLAIDKERLVAEDLYGISELVFGPFPSDEQTFNYGKSLSEAKTQLEKAGAKDSNQDGIMEIKEKTLSFKLSIISESESEKVAERIKNDWAQIGVSLEIEKSSTAEFERDIIKPRNYELLFIGQSYGEDKGLYPFWHSSQLKTPGLNFSTITSARVDALLENQMFAKDEEKEKISSTIKNYLNDKKLAIFLYAPVYNFATDKSIRGIGKPKLIYPEHRFINIEKWYTETKRGFGR